MLLRFIILLSLTSPFFLYAQNIDLYITLLEKGKINDVRENLPGLLERYPNEAGVFFLKALTSSNGDEAISIYEKLISNYPNSDYTQLSEMKIGILSGEIPPPHFIHQLICTKKKKKRITGIA